VRETARASDLSDNDEESLGGSNSDMWNAPTTPSCESREMTSDLVGHMDFEELVNGEECV